MRKVLLTISVLALLFSCEPSENLNVDKKSASSVPASGLFTNGLRNFFDQVNSCNVNQNVLRLYAQYWSQCTYPEESQYVQVTRDIGGDNWDNMYRDVLQDLKGSKEQIMAADNVDNAQNKLACIGVVEVMAYAYLVDLFGDVPYTEALDPTNPGPKYDDAETIYMDLFTKLDAAIGMMNTSSPGFEAVQDPVYGGDMSQWKMAANSLKLRMAMRLADANPSVSKSMAEAALSSGVIEDNVDNCSITYLSASPNTNPVWVSIVQSGRNDFVGSNTLIDYLNDLSDPRRDTYFEEYDGAYVGGTYGSANSYELFSHLSNELIDPALPGNFITAAEVQFLMAEAAVRGYSGTLGASTHYTQGIWRSMIEWGIDDADFQAYIANPDVAWNTAPGTDMQKIAMQKWIAMFNNGMEGWTTYRLFDWPVLNEIETGEATPKRFLYPLDEPTLNGPMYDAASAAIGGDTKQTRIFFDMN